MFHLRIKNLRKNRYLTQKQVFTAIDMAERNYQALEYGTIKPSYDTIVKLCKYYNISADFLLGLSDDPRPLE